MPKNNIPHVSLTTPDITKDCLKLLHSVVPEVFSEGKVDFEKLKVTLGEIVDDSPERYSFTWAGKKDAIRILQTTSHTTLTPLKEESVDFDKTQNVFIEGDNLEAMKLLYKPYFGRVKMIYIDPPYNTGSDFIYPDNFANPLDNYLKLTGQKDSEGNLLTSNPESGGRYHSAWLSMMYPRLFLARQLLSEDGVIFVSIDDHENYSLRLLLNEIFGEEGYLTTFVWRRRIGSSMASSWVSADHEYVIGYSKNPDLVFVRGDERDMTKYNIPDGKGRLYASMPLTVGMTKAMRPNQWYELKNPKTGKGYWPPEGRVWGFYPPTMDQKILEDKIIWPEDFPEKKLTTPRYKTYPEDAKRERKPVSTWITEKNSKEFPNEDVYSLSSAKNEEGTRILKGLLGDSSFSYPKPLSLLRALVEQFSKDDDVVMDFFAGSATLAQAIYELNREYGENRHFILVQLPEKTDNPELKTIAEIGKERIRRVAKRMKQERKGQFAFDKDEDLGFKSFKLSASNFRQWSGEEVAEPQSYINQMQIFSEPLIEGWSTKNVIYEVAIKEGFGLNISVEKSLVENISLVRDLNKNQSFYITLSKTINIDDLRPLSLKADDLFICLDNALNDETAANLALQCRLKTI